MEENKEEKKEKDMKNVTVKKGGGKHTEEDLVSRSSLTERTARRSRHSNDSIDIPSDLMSVALSKTVTDNIIAGPHGALHTVNAVPPDRWSFVSTHTLLMRRRSNSLIDDPVDFESAITETGHGCFQYKLLAICGFIYSCCSLSTTTLSFVLPAAQFDFNLDSVKKGVLNTAPLWGMVAGAYIWGNFADNKGRRFVLMWTLLIDSIASFSSSFCQGFEVFYAFRIFNGFAIIGATSIIFAYMGEFLDHAHRDVFLTRLELFWTFGIISLPVIGLVILPLKISWGDRDTFIYNSWRVFVFTCGIPSLISSILIFLMPESPRFLLIQGKLEKTRQVLERMFVSNTRKPKKEFSVKVLSESPEADSYYFQRVRNISFCKRVKNLLKGIYKQHKDLFRGRSLFNILITCFVDFGLIFVYYTMMLWVPELLNREEQYVEEHKNDTKHPTLCQTASFNLKQENDSEIKMATFVHTIITCLACLPTTLMLLCLINRLSKKALLVGIMVFAAVPAVFLPHAVGTFQVVTALSLLKSLTNLAEAILFVAIVEIFPISTRGTALSLTVTVGRIGSIVGNIIFGHLIDKHCEKLFYIMGGNLVVIGLVCILLPKMRRGH